MQIPKLSFPRYCFHVVFVLALSALSTAQAQTSPDHSATQARITREVDEKNRVTLQGNVHPFARPEFDRGAAPEGQPLKRMLLLLQRGPEQEAALQTLLEEQQDKSSPNYHAWLTPEKFGKQFGPADADTQAVTDWLTSQGFTDIKVGP